MARRDPALNSRKHRDHNRALLAGAAVAVRALRWPDRLRRATAAAQRAENLRYLVVGHIVSRSDGLAQGWSIAQINDLSNTQPECWECSITSGGVESVRVRQGALGRSAKVVPAAPEAGNW
jgi:hypothetical protein